MQVVSLEVVTWCVTLVGLARTVKFYTEDGNWDLVGNNTPIFFIRDPILVREWCMCALAVGLNAYVTSNYGSHGQTPPSHKKKMTW